MQHDFDLKQTNDYGIMLFRSQLMFLTSEKLVWDWASLTEIILRSMAALLNKFRSDIKIFE